MSLSDDACFVSSNCGVLFCFVDLPFGKPYSIFLIAKHDVLVKETAANRLLVKWGKLWGEGKCATII